MRRQFFTHPRFQAGFIASFLVGVLLIIILQGVTTLSALFLLRQDPLVLESQREILTSASLAVFRQLMIISVAAVVIFGGIGFYLSYKFVGPLYRLENWLQSRIENKDALPFKVRPGDELTGVCDVLNRLIQRKFGGPS